MDSCNMKALYIVVNAGFAERIVEFILEKGASGATIVNARGISSMHKEIMGISTDVEKEIILTITSAQIAQSIMSAVKETAGLKSEIHGICFVLPVSNVVGIGEPLAQVSDHQEKN